MDIFFQDLDEAPLPPAEVRIRELSAEWFADGKRLHIAIELAPFQKRPSLDLAILDASGQLVAQADIIETMSRRLELTLHLRSPQRTPPFTLTALLFYADAPSQDQPQLAERRIVDQRSLALETPPSAA